MEGEGEKGKIKINHKCVAAPRKEGVGNVGKKSQGRK